MLLALCAGNSLVTGEFPPQRPVTWSFDVFFDLHLNKQLSKQLWGWWFEMQACSLWRHCLFFLIHQALPSLTRSNLVDEEEEDDQSLLVRDYFPLERISVSCCVSFILSELCVSINHVFCDFLPLSPPGWRGIVITVRAGGCQTCGTHISVTAWRIFSIQSSVELSRPVGVHCHDHMPICPIWACPWAKNLSNLPQIGSRLCGKHISETAGWIYPI